MDNFTTSRKQDSLTGCNKRTLTVCISMVIFILYILSLPLYAQQWKEEFEDICANVSIAHTLTIEQLQELINRADTLICKLQKMDIKAKRIYIFRLEKCKKFFQYSMKLKSSGKE